MLKLTRLESTSIASCIEEYIAVLRNRIDEREGYVHPAVHYEEIQAKLNEYLDEEYSSHYSLSASSPMETRKPLKDLVGAEKDCQSIYKLLFGEEYKHRIVTNEMIQMHGQKPGTTINLYFSGCILIFQDPTTFKNDFFALTDHIRKIGYEPVAMMS